MIRTVISGMGIVSKYAVEVGTFLENITSKNIKKLYSEDELKDLIKEMTKKPPLDKYDLSNWRSMDQLTRMAVVASLMAVEDAGLDSIGGENMGVFFGTVFGCLESNVSFNQKLLTSSPRFVSRMVFCNTVSNAAVGHIGLILKAKGMHSTFASGGAYPLIYGLQQLKSGRIRQAVVGGMDKLTPIAIQGMRELGLLAEGNNNGFDPEDGAGALVIESQDSCIQRKGRILTELIGYGVGDTFKASMQDALIRSNLQKTAVGLVILADNGTENFRNELVDIKDLFSDNKSLQVDMIKKEIGETFGASLFFSLIKGIALLQKYERVMINTASIDYGSKATFIIQRPGLRGE